METNVFFQSKELRRVCKIEKCVEKMSSFYPSSPMQILVLLLLGAYGKNMAT